MFDAYKTQKNVQFSRNFRNLEMLNFKRVLRVLSNEKKGGSLGFPISSKKIIPRKTEQDGIDHCFIGIPPVSRNKKLSEFRYKSFQAENFRQNFVLLPFLR